MIKGRKLNKFAISLPWVCGFENDNYSLSDKILLFGEEWLDYIRLVPQPVGYLPKYGAGKKAVGDILPCLLRFQLLM